MSSEGYLNAAALIVGIPLFSAIGAWSLSLFVDKFCSANVDMAIIRMIEEINQGRPRQIPTILKGLSEEERLRILERVLDNRLYSKELGAQVKLELEKSEENERMQQMENALLKKSTGTATETATAQDVNNNNNINIDITQDDQEEKVGTGDNDSEDDNHEEPEDMNILQRVWMEFGDRGKGNGNKDGKKKDEVSETCAICMEDYEDDQDVIIGDNCVHMYHKDCLLKWMKAKHDFCPYCRSYVFPVSDFISIAKEQVGEERFAILVEEDDPELVAMYIGPNGHLSEAGDTAPSSPDNEEGSSSA